MERTRARIVGAAAVAVPLLVLLAWPTGSDTSSSALPPRPVGTAREVRAGEIPSDAPPPGAPGGARAGRTKPVTLHASPRADLPLDVTVVDAHTGLPVAGARVHRTRRGRFEIEGVPDGYVAWDPLDWSATPAAGALRQVATYPLRREARVRLRVADPVAELAIAIGDREVGVGHVDEEGDVDVRGIPFFPHAELGVLSVLVEDPVHDVKMSWLCGNALPPFRPSVFPEPRTSAGRSPLRLGSDPSEEVVVEVDPTRWAPGGGEVVVPFRRARPNDPFEQPATGSYGSLHVEVVDGEGRPVPYATVHLHLPSWRGFLDLAADGVQRLDPFTDARGRRTYLHVPPGDVRVVSRWGPLSGYADVPVRGGKTDATVRIRLR